MNLGELGLENEEGKSRVKLATQSASRTYLPFFAEDFSALRRGRGSLCLKIYFATKYLNASPRRIMPPRRAVRDRLARRNVEDQGVPNAPEGKLKI
uniref:Uncharacterized protein n=1 Tax=Solanum tuberosum TaxID=4113 RepID=M1DTZ6_SOLTU